jgi:hypothetical protein
MSPGAPAELLPTSCEEARIAYCGARHSEPACQRAAERGDVRIRHSLAVVIHPSARPPLSLPRPACLPAASAACTVCPRRRHCVRIGSAFERPSHEGDETTQEKARLRVSSNPCPYVTGMGDVCTGQSGPHGPRRPSAPSFFQASAHRSDHAMRCPAHITPSSKST